MKVLLVNGSPHAVGCTYTALMEVAGALKTAGIETELFQLGVRPIGGCMGCGACKSSGRCVQTGDPVNAFLDEAAKADGFVFGSAVHYAGATGAITSFLDRVFYAGAPLLAHKPGAVLVSCRRGGSTSALEQLEKYCTINQMPLVSSQYWNMVHGNSPEEVRQDKEGLQIMRTLGRNMAWLLHCIAAGRAAGIQPPAPEKERARTNFIR